MLPINLLTPVQIKKQIAGQAKQRRLSKNLSRQTLSEKSGIPSSTIKRFETTGDISLESLLTIAWILDGLDDFLKLFAFQIPASFHHFPVERQRGRK